MHNPAALCAVEHASTARLRRLLDLISIIAKLQASHVAELFTRSKCDTEIGAARHGSIDTFNRQRVVIAFGRSHPTEVGFTLATLSREAADV